MKKQKRIDRIRKVLCENQWDLLVCALPMNVLLLSGYWPVVGTAVAVASSDGRIHLLVPKEEEDLAKHGWADEIRTFKPGSLDELTTTAEEIRKPLRQLAESFSPASRRVAFEAYEASEPAYRVGASTSFRMPSRRRTPVDRGADPTEARAHPGRSGPRRGSVPSTCRTSSNPSSPPSRWAAGRGWIP